VGEKDCDVDVLEERPRGRSSLARCLNRQGGSLVVMRSEGIAIL
jgi:hypothetical protein